MPIEAQPAYTAGERPRNRGFGAQRTISGAWPQQNNYRVDGVSSPSVQTLADAERAHIMTTIRENNWVVLGRNGAATRLGVPRTTLIARMQRLELSMHGSRMSEAQQQFSWRFQGSAVSKEEKA